MLYTDDVKRDEEKISTGAVCVNMTKDSLIKAAVPKIQRMWLLNELPPGDSRCRDKPPSWDLVEKALDSLRTTFGADIHFANNDAQWYNLFPI